MCKIAILCSGGDDTSNNKSTQCTFLSSKIRSIKTDISAMNPALKRFQETRSFHV